MTYSLQLIYMLQLMLCRSADHSLYKEARMPSPQGRQVRRISAASRPSPVKGTASVAPYPVQTLWYKPPSNVDPCDHQCLDDFPGLAVIEHVHDIACRKVCGVTGIEKCTP